MKNTDTNVNLNVQELGVLLSALQLLEYVDEHHIAKEYVVFLHFTIV